MHEVVIVSACRTAIGSFLGKLKDIHVKDMGAIVGREAINRAGIKVEDIDEIVCGSVIQAGCGGNVARQIQGIIGVPWSSPACTVNQLCSSGMRAFEMAVHNIMTGRTETALAIGVENMTMSPYLIPRARTGYRMGNCEMPDAMLLDALICSIEGYHMGVTAENVALSYGISRQEQDDLALLSQQRAAEAIRKGVFKDEIVSVTVTEKKQTITFEVDEHPRPATSSEALSALKPVFKKDGTVTAGNASGVNDGAAAVVIMSVQKAETLGIKPLVKVLSTASAGVDPAVMGIGPAVSIPKALYYAGLSLNDIDYFEINEAFAAQFIGVQKKIKYDTGYDFNMDTVNRNGSGISLGHPVGCTGLRIVVSLIYEMNRTHARLGCASLCAGGGPSMAAVIELAG